MHRARPWIVNAILLLISVSFSLAAFIAIDYVYTSAMNRRRTTTAKISQCRLPDPERHHAFQPNCTALTAWGSVEYRISTNNLGFRDEKVRDVPLRAERPRILILGDSFTEGLCPWRDSYVGKIATALPQYEFLNGGMTSYSPSNYLNVARTVLAKGVQIDEVLVFIDISDTQDEAAYYSDIDDSGAVRGPGPHTAPVPPPPRWLLRIRNHLMLTNYFVEFVERTLIKHGLYHYYDWGGDIFDSDRSAWTYRSVPDNRPYPYGYAPLGVDGGVAKSKAKMMLLWQELTKRHIPLGVVVYPWPSQVAHDTADSRQARIWREWCNGKCNRFISLFPAFQAVKSQSPRTAPGRWYLNYFIFGDTHYSPAGNAIVAGEVIRSFEAEPPRKAIDME
jgi:hypothetical protein